MTGQAAERNSLVRQFFLYFLSGGCYSFTDGRYSGGNYTIELMKNARTAYGHFASADNARTHPEGAGRAAGSSIFEYVHPEATSNGFRIFYTDPGKADLVRYTS